MPLKDGLAVLAVFINVIMLTDSYFTGRKIYGMVNTGKYDLNKIIDCVHYPFLLLAAVIQAIWLIVACR
jgi:hypothetical protein